MMVLQLGPWGKVLVMAIGAGVVMITLIIVVCFVGPGCWGYEWMHREEERRRRRQANGYANHIAEDTLKLSDYDYPWKRNHLPSYASHNTVNSVNSTGSLIGRMANHRDSTYSSMSEATDNRSLLSMKSVTTEDSCSNDCSANNGPPVLTMSLQYVANDENGTGRLVINIKDVKSLPSREYAGGLEPYLVVQVARTTWPLHRRAGPALHELRTRTLRHSFNPFFDETFVLDVKRSELKEWCLKVTAYDQDKYSNATELCDVSLALRDVKNLTTAREALTISCNLVKTNREVGDLLFGVSYLPTAQRLSVSVIKASNLKYLEIADSIADFNPYVRVIQLSGSSGRSIKRKKTAFKHGTESPEFNETLTFDLSPSHLETTTFLVLLCSRTLCEASDGQTGKKCKDKCLGKVAIGSHVVGKQQRQHWLSVIQSPRRVVSAWYTLR
ncbi:Synaptotagmin-3 [Zootermopsis nevadensis]|uniref:Synaptotagmin-3 n=3 Tax=Zootermopsis nevadensis TaxID=136037 RepID=A0A067RBP8_ZOONE|nr:Synaptotagmin-3 [Zootermopsis nevadensis]